MKIQVKKYSNRINAEIDKRMLENHEIPSVIEADDGGGWFHDQMMSTGGVRLYVPKKCKEKALRLIKDSE